jgi:predicted Abi (CAAX) family protease
VTDARSCIVITPAKVRKEWQRVENLSSYAAALRKDYETTRAFLVSQGRADLLPDEYQSRWRSAK